MAAHVSHVTSQSSDGSQNREGAGGVSYASAVLNLKNMDNNKENINAATVRVSPNDSVTNETPVKSKITSIPQQKIGRQSNTYATGGKPIANTEDFPQINTVNTKNVRRLGYYTKVDKEQVSNKQNPKNPTCDSVTDNSDNTVKASPISEVSEGDSNTETVEEVPEKKKFVEAPLPKINPWTKNKNAASVITGKASDQQLPIAASTEKRVLQPQQQGTVGKSFITSF